MPKKSIPASGRKTVKNTDTIDFISYGNSGFFVFELDKPVTGKIGYIENPNIKFAKKSPFVLTMDGMPCATNFRLCSLANDIKDGRVRNGAIARITFSGMTKCKKGKVAVYDIELEKTAIQVK